MKAEDRKALYSVLQTELLKLRCMHEISWILDFIESKNFSTFGEQESCCREILERKKKNEPLAYIFGEWSFRSYDFFVGPGALIPRPETEELVEAIIMCLENSLSTSNKILSQSFHIVDLGAGTGCIGLSLVADLLRDIEEENSGARLASKNFQVTFVEKSPEALKWLKKNIEAFREKIFETRVHIIETDWNDALLEKVDVLVSNPPYISHEEFNSLDESVREYEPHAALLCKTPHQPYLEIMKIGKESLLPGGWLFAEIGPAQGESLQEALASYGAYNDVRTLKDIAKKPRILCAKRADG